MNTSKKFTAYILAFTFVAAVTFVYLLISIALIPYWQELSGSEIQAWWAGPFSRFANLMVPVHLLSIITMVYAFIVNRKGEDSLKVLWVVALFGLLICQIFNFSVFGSMWNIELQSGILDPSAALETLDKWDFYHNIRTLSVTISLIILIVIGIKSKKQPTS